MIKINEIITKLEAMLGTGYEITNTNNPQAPIKIMTPFVDALGDYTIVYIEYDKNKQLYRYTDDGWTVDNLESSGPLDKHRIPMILNSYATKLNDDTLNSPWLNQEHLVASTVFYEYLQSILEVVTVICDKGGI